MANHVQNGSESARRRLLETAGLSTAPILLVLAWIGFAIRGEHQKLETRHDDCDRQLQRIERRLRDVEADTDRVERRTRFLPELRGR